MCMLLFEVCWILLTTCISAKTRIQALPKGKDQDEQSMFGVLLQVFKKEGILGLYRGFGATMINTFSMRAFYPKFHFDGR